MKLKKVFLNSALLLIATAFFFIGQNALIARGEVINEKKGRAGSAIKRLFKGLIGISPTNGNTIGCILPFSGEYAIYGQKALHGIELAVDEFNSETSASPIKLVVKDSKFDPQAARKAVEDLVYKEGVIAIIGPLSGVATMAAAERAERLQVPIVTMTQSEGITQRGDYVFRNFLTPSLQIRALATYVTEILRLDKFAILHPNDNYGKKFMNLFQKEVERLGGEVVEILSYDKDQTDFGDVIKEMVRLPPFDAIFIPDSYKKVGIIAPQLAFYDVTEIYLLGTNLWDSPQLPKMAGSYLKKAIFVDSFFKESSLTFVKKFVADFYSSFGEEPGILEAHAYDITTLLISLLRERQVDSRHKMKEELLKTKDFLGITGTTTFTPSGDAEKTLYMLTIRGSRIMELH